MNSAVSLTRGERLYTPGFGDGSFPGAFQLIKSLCVAVFGAAAAAVAVGATTNAVAQTSAPFVIQTQLNGGCLTANNNPAVAGGNVFVDNCMGLPTQQWIAEPVGADSALMRSAAVPTLCLNGGDAVGRGGALRMEACNRGSITQVWITRDHPGSPGFSYMQLAVGLSGQCVEANLLRPGMPLAGASFMDRCQNVTGQAWTISGGAPVAPAASAPAYAPPAAPAVHCCDAIIFQDWRYGGVSWPLPDEVPNLRDVTGSNDQASSMRIAGGVWQVCENSDYRGRCEIVSSDVPDLNAIGMNDSISSVRRIR